MHSEMGSTNIRHAAAEMPVSGTGLRAEPRGKVAVLHAGVSGMCSAIALARQHDVVIQDDRSTAVQMILNGCAPSDDPEIQRLPSQTLRTLRATQDRREALAEAGLVVVTTPTGYTRWRRMVDTSDLDRVLRDVARINPLALVVMVSTLPVGYTRAMAQRLRLPRLLAVPDRRHLERAIFDHQQPPAALIVGGPPLAGSAYAEHWLSGTVAARPTCLFTGSAEAEAIHLLHRKRELLGAELAHSELLAYAARHALDVRQLCEGLALMAPMQPAEDSRTPAPSHAITDHKPSQATSMVCM
jgi:UDPglucose 6-dehydrogenase